MSEKVIYTYKNCKKEDFASDVSFDEFEFSGKLEKCLNTSNVIKYIEVVFMLEKDMFECEIKCGIFDKVITVKKADYKNHTKTVHKAIKETIDLVRKDKEKHNKKHEHRGVKK